MTSWTCDCRLELKVSHILNPEPRSLKTIEQMPTDYCQYFWECPHCKNNLKPKEGECCVYCSYGSVKCPPIQKGTNC